jgi:hypothetical protein
MLTNAGFLHIDITMKQLDLQLPDLTDFVPRHVSATLMVMGFNAAANQTQRAVVLEVADQLSQYQTLTGVCIPFRTIFAMGNKDNDQLIRNDG